MKNVGDIETFEVFGDLPAGQDFTFVWKWWDGEVTATTTQSTTKRINMGGNPADNNLLRYTVTMVDQHGASETYEGFVEVNNPPSIVPPPTVTPNDSTFPFSTVLRLQTFDFETPTQTYQWFQGSTFLGNGTITSAGSVAGYYAGTLVNNFASSANELTYIANSNEDVRAYAFDGAGGTTTFDFQVRGKNPPNPFSSFTIATPGAIFEVIAQPTRVGPGQLADFYLYTPILDNEPTFLWEYETTAGWIVNSSSAGATTAQPNGSFVNKDSKALDTETEGIRQVRVTITDPPSGNVTVVTLTLELFPNSAPTGVTVTTSSDDNDMNVAVDDVIQYTASASDPDDDLLRYKWNFSVPATGVLWGRTVMVSTAGLSAGQILAGTLTVIDRLNAETTVTLPAVFVQV